MSRLKRFLTYLAAGWAIALLLSIVSNTLTSSPASAQFRLSSPADLPAASTTLGNLADLDLSSDLESFIPPGLSQSDNPVEGGRGVIGPDDRQPMTSSAYPWSAIGRVVSEVPIDETTLATFACTGTLVDTDIVLTNAHCIVDPATHEFRSAVYFQPNLVDGLLLNEEDEAIAITMVAATDFRDDTVPPHADDWALLKLDKPLGNTYGTIGWASLPLPTLVENYREQLIMVGYSGDFPADNPGETAGVHEGCSILGEYEASVVHDCDTTGGSSGGPILAMIDGTYQIVAVNSAEYTQLLTEDGAIEPRRVGIENYAVQIPRIVERLAAR